MSSSYHPMPHSQRVASNAYTQSQYSKAPPAFLEASTVVATHGGKGVAVTSAPNEQTLLQCEVLDKAKEKLDVMLCTFTTNLQKDEELTKETRGYRDAVAEDLTSLLGLLNELSFANEEAAIAIRQILAHDITNPVHTARVDVHIDSAVQALIKASRDLMGLEKNFVRHRTELGLASEQTAGVLRTIGNFCYDYGIIDTTSRLSLLATFTSAVLNFPLHGETPKTVGAALGLFGFLLLGAEKLVTKKCEDSAGYANLPKQKDAILTVAASINSLLEVLAALHQTWTHVQQTELRQNYKSAQTNAPDPDVLAHIADTLEAHDSCLKQLLAILRPKAALVIPGLDRKQIEAPLGIQAGPQSSTAAPPPHAPRSNRLWREPRFSEAIEALGNLNNV